MATINIINTGTPGQAITKDVTDNSLTKLASVSGVFTQNSLIVAQDVDGSIKNLANVNSAVLVTDATGTPTYSSTLTDGQIIIGDTSGTPVAGTITGSGSAVVTVGAGTIDISVIAGTVSSSTANNLAYYAANGDTVSGLATANNGILVTSSTGVPSIGNSVGADLTINTVRVGLGAGSVASNTAVGAGALAANTTGLQQTTLGFQAGAALTTGNNNTLLGYQAGNTISSGANNVCIGNSAGKNLPINAGSNVVIGSTALSNATGGLIVSNVFIGNAAALSGNLNLNSNVGIGFGALQNINNANSNVCVGASAGANVSQGIQNVLIGAQAGAYAVGGSTIGNGTDNTFLGTRTNADSSTCTGAIVIGSTAKAISATGTTSGDFSAGITFGSTAFPVGVRGDGTVITGGVGRGYWRPYINGTAYLMPLFINGTTTANASMVTDANGSPILSNAMTDGQLIIGSSSGQPQAANLTAGSGISITNSANGISIAATTTAFSYNNVTGTTQTLANGSGYIANNPTNLITFTLPTTAAVGTFIEIVGAGAGLWTLAQNAGQNILVVGATTTTGVGGSLSATEEGDGIKLVCVVADTTWTGIPTGNLTIV